MTPNDDDLDRLLGSLADDPLDDAFEPRLHAALVDASVAMRAAAAARRRRVTRVALIVAATMVPAVGLAFYAAYRAANPPTTVPESSTPAIRTAPAEAPARERIRPRPIESVPVPATPDVAPAARPIERVSPSLERPFANERFEAPIGPTFSSPVTPEAAPLPPSAPLPPNGPEVLDAPSGTARPPIERLHLEFRRDPPPTDVRGPGAAPPSGSSAHGPRAPVPPGGAPPADPTGARRPPSEAPPRRDREARPDVPSSRPEPPRPLDRPQPPERPMPMDRPPPP